MILSFTRRIAAAAAIAATGGLLVAAAGPAGASQHASAQQRQIGVAELSAFKVVLTATRDGGQPPTATVTAAGYERSGSAWKLVSVRQIGARGEWFWYAVQTCSLNTIQFRGISPKQAVDTIKVSLLATPALGCTKPFTERWKP